AGTVVHEVRVDDGPAVRMGADPTIHPLHHHPDAIVLEEPVAHLGDGGRTADELALGGDLPDGCATSPGRRCFEEGIQRHLTPGQGHHAAIRIIREVGGIAAGAADEEGSEDQQRREGPVVGRGAHPCSVSKRPGSPQVTRAPAAPHSVTTGLETPSVIPTHSGPCSVPCIPSGSFTSNPGPRKEGVPTWFDRRSCVSVPRGGGWRTSPPRCRGWCGRVG